MISLDASSVLLQWATGGLLFYWVTARHRLVGLGYNWLIHAIYAVLAFLAFVVGARFGFVPVRDLAALFVAVASAALLALAFVRRKREGVQVYDLRLELVAPAVGLLGLVAAGVNAGEPVWLSIARMLVGAAFLGVVFDAMLLGHWYLVQPGLSRAPLLELTKWTGALWLPEVILLLVPTGMVSVWTGAIDDGYAGMLGWFWGACVVTTIGLIIATLAALREKEYSAVMAATGLLYLSILTAFGIDLVARASLA